MPETPIAISRILLFNPPSGLYRRDDRCQSKVEEQTVQVIFPPIDLAYIAAAAERAGASVRIADYPAMGQGWEAFVADLSGFRPELLVFDVTSATFERDLRACRIARENAPGILTAARGEYLTTNGREVLEHTPELDLVLVGEAEVTIAELVANGISSEQKGIMFRGDDGEVMVTERQPPLEDLDSLPFPARHLLDNDLYRSPETGNKLTVVHANRGCPAKCIFCPAGTISGYRVRNRSPQCVVDELRECVEKFGIREFLLHGDTFTMKKSWLLELCRLIVDSGLKIRWGCNSRVDTMDEERAQWLKRAGCWVVAFGVESGSQLMLDKMKKGTKVEQAGVALAACKKAGLMTHTFFIIGLPWETKQTLNETYTLIRKLDPDFFDINIAYPLPGTEYFEICEREGLLISPEAVAEGSYGKAAVRTHELAPEELTAWRRRTLMRLYLRPHYILRTLKHAARSPRVLKNYLKSAWNRIRHLVSA